jgi:hypothetical protein
MIFVNTIREYFDFLTDSDYVYYINVERDALDDCIVNVYSPTILNYLQTCVRLCKDMLLPMITCVNKDEEWKMVIFHSKMHYEKCFLLQDVLFINCDYLMDCVENNNIHDFVEMIGMNKTIQYMNMHEEYFDNLINKNFKNTIYYVEKVKHEYCNNFVEYSHLSTYHINKQYMFIIKKKNKTYTYKTHIANLSPIKYSPYYNYTIYEIKNNDNKPTYKKHYIDIFENVHTTYNDITMTLIHKMFFNCNHITP